MTTEYKNKLDSQQVKDSKLILANSEKINKAEVEFKKTLIPIITVILGLIVSLNDTSNDAVYKDERIAFVFTVAICGLCILFGVISLYKPIHLDRKIQNLLHKEVQKIELRTSPTLISAEPNVFFLISEKLFYFLFVSSIISLIIYAVLR